MMIPGTDDDHILHSEGGRFTANTTSQIGDVARILNYAARQQPENGLVLNFHGGLVNHRSGVAGARKRTKPYLHSNAYPVFFVWESGFAEAFWNSCDDWGRDASLRKLREKAQRFVSVPQGEVEPRLLAVAVPDPDLDELTARIEADIMADASFRVTLGAKADLGPKPAVGGLQSDGVEGSDDPRFDMDTYAAVFGAPDEVGLLGFYSWGKVAAFVARVVLSTHRRYRDGTDHGLHCTVVEELLRIAFVDRIGVGAWSRMKDDTEQSFEPDGCGRVVVDHLAALERGREGVSPFSKITLVGHSTGAIYICNFLRAARASAITTPIDVVFLAPAVTYSRFAEEVVAKEASSWRDFRMFTMTEEAEIGDQLLSEGLYSRSLLYFISGLLEQSPGGEAAPSTPLVGLVRFQGAIGVPSPDRDQVNAFLTGGNVPRVVLSPTIDAPDGFQSNARAHGRFDDDGLTVASIQKIIAGASALSDRYANSERPVS